MPIDINTLRKATTTDVVIDEDTNVNWNDNAAADSYDNKLQEKSEIAYQKIASKIVHNSKEQLDTQNVSKNRLKTIFTIFFIIFISIQLSVLFALLFIKAFVVRCALSDTVILTYITTVFAETLGAIVLMIKYAFDSAQEVKILEILNGVISNYKKFEKK